MFYSSGHWKVGLDSCETDVARTQLRVNDNAMVPDEVVESWEEKMGDDWVTVAAILLECHEDDYQGGGAISREFTLL